MVLINIKKMIIKVISKSVLLGLLLFSVQANAWVVLDQGASVLFNAEHYSNIDLDTEDEQSAWVYTVAPGYRITAGQDKSQLFLNANLNIERSSDKDLSGDREDPNVRAGWGRDYDKGSVGLVATYAKASTRITELTDSGNVTEDGSSIGRSIAATWIHSLTEKLGMSFEGRHLRQDFTGDQLSDYRLNSLSSEFLYELSEQTSPFVRVSLNQFHPLDDIDVNVRTEKINYQNYLAGANFILSPKLSFSAGAGVSHIEEYSDIEEDGNRWIGLSSVTYQGEKYRLDGAVERSISPSSEGILRESDSFLLGYSYDLSDRSHWGVDLSLNKNKTGDRSESQQIGAWYSRDLSELWQMRLSARLRTIDSDEEDSADGNIIGISFRYDTPSF